MRRSDANFKFKKVKKKEFKVLMQTRKHETMTFSNKLYIYIRCVLCSFQILGGSFACFKLFTEINNITFKLRCDAICKV